ncbi:hypothetical protein Clacol_006122 [Clathrus columnatus]|uniref:Exocyst complex component 8 n=1 Tax=Clathrus columnatus TaxID=1419009 RepID=A0AAV5AFC4_9AGAM|nr:hypothetical protein Clacol_006122 [Clathrus columnatus]
MSLRKQRPDGNPSTNGKLRQPQQRIGRNGTRVEDRIKQRMSMRYADISAPTDLQAIPDIPALPINFRTNIPGSIREEDEFGIQKEPQAKDPRRDLKSMEQDDFDPEIYLKSKLANSTEAELKALESSLKTSKDLTLADLQKSVFNNYEQFMSISKDVVSLENDLLELKSSLSEWKSMPSLLQVEDAATNDRRRVTRSSVADLRTLYASQLQTLHTTIEGSAKFVPAMPGRHIIAEQGDITALNPATYRPEHSVHFVLLDDSLLVAKQRQKRTGGTGKLVADRCWTLADLVVQDLKDTNDVTNVVKIRHGKETFVYRFEQLKDKKTWLVSFRQASEELAARRRKEREGEHERRRSVWADGNSTLKIPDIDKMPPLPDWLNDYAASQGLSNSKEKEERDTRFVDDFVDDLTVAIALREWDKATAMVQDGENRVSTTPLLGPKIPPLKTSLINALLITLSDPMQRKSSIMHLSSLLESLQAGVQARRAFLKMRGELIQQRIRALRFEGSVELYISDLATVIFTSIKHTCEWFLATFTDHDTASSLVYWAKGQIEKYAEMFRKQVHGSDISPQTVEECLEITRIQGRKLLRENSLDFSHLLEELLKQPIQETSPTPPPSKPTLPPLERVTSMNLSTEDLSTIITSSPRPARPPRNLPPRSQDRPRSVPRPE